VHRSLDHGGDPLSVLRALMAPYRPVTVPGLPRFWGGLVGWFAYETVSFFERIPHGLSPEEPLAHVVMTDELLIFDNVRHTLTLLVPVYRENDADEPERLYDEAVSRLEKLAESLGQPLQAPAVPLAEPASAPSPQPFGPREENESNAIQRDAAEAGAFRSPLSRDAFLAMVRTVQEHITAGDVIQTVISQPFVLQPSPDPWFLYRAQRYVNPSPYMFFMELDDRILVGSSPETMVRLENGVATLRPIAGTRPRGATEQEDRRLADELLKDPKERAEHLMLVDLGRNDLGRVAETGTVQVTDLMVVERYSHVMHLVSNITCDLRRDADAWDLLRATFPAGTLTGAPKIRAMEIIAALEPAPRGPYGGAVGYISFTGNMDLAITIRTACLQNGTMTVQTGAGIVADSIPEREYEETVNKAKAMLKAVALLHQATHEPP
jgi:anthranilate synthase component 1